MSANPFQAGDLVVSREEVLPGIRLGATYAVVNVARSSIWLIDDDGDKRVRPAANYRLLGTSSEVSEAQSKPAQPAPAEAPATINFKGWGAWA